MPRTVVQIEAGWKGRGGEPREEMGKRKKIYWSGTASVIIK